MANQRVVLITGGSKRIGANIAKYFHKKGFKVIIHFNSSIMEAENLRKELIFKRKDSCITIQADFSDEGSTKKGIKEILNSTKT